MSSLERQVFVISDLHLGGKYPDSGREGDRGFRICTHVPELTEFVLSLAERPGTGPQIELVINGDAIDFLAEGDSGWVPFMADPDKAANRFDSD